MTYLSILSSLSFSGVQRFVWRRLRDLSFEQVPVWDDDQPNGPRHLQPMRRFYDREPSLRDSIRQTPDQRREHRESKDAQRQQRRGEPIRLASSVAGTNPDSDRGRSRLHFDLSAVQKFVTSTQQPSRSESEADAESKEGKSNRPPKAPREPKEPREPRQPKSKRNKPAQEGGSAIGESAAIAGESAGENVEAVSASTSGENRHGNKRRNGKNRDVALPSSSLSQVLEFERDAIEAPAEPVVAEHSTTTAIAEPATSESSPTQPLASLDSSSSSTANTEPADAAQRAAVEVSAVAVEPRIIEAAEHHEESFSAPAFHESADAQ